MPLRPPQFCEPETTIWMSFHLMPASLSAVVDCVRRHVGPELLRELAPGVQAYSDDGDIVHCQTFLNFQPTSSSPLLFGVQHADDCLDFHADGDLLRVQSSIMPMMLMPSGICTETTGVGI